MESPDLSREKTYRQVVKPIDRVVQLSERRFDVKTLPVDMRRVYHKLSARFGEEYGLVFVFAMRTAMELHRAWNMTLLTSNVLQQIKDEFGMRMTWTLGVVKLKFRAEDGGHELHRKVPYDYDSEYQDRYYRIAMALVEGHINVHEALLYQNEVGKSKHTAASGLLLLRNYPGRVLLYPFQAATCAIIFFSGQWHDAAVAAICGLAAGLIDYALGLVGGQATVLLDVLVGISTGIIGGLWYIYEQKCCLSSIFLGTLYWFFYGTAFVVGILEIIAGELETGVTRFVGVSVKTFLLSLGAGIGLMISARGGAAEIWFESEGRCDDGFVKGEWFRVPMYLLCSVAVLGQYRLPFDRYWLGLSVQLAAYEAQYQVFNGIGEFFTTDHLDTTVSNIAGAVVGVLSAYALCRMFDATNKKYCARILHNDEENSAIGRLAYWWIRLHVQLNSFLRIARKSDFQKLGMERRLKDLYKELNDPSHPRENVALSPEDEELFLETVVGAQDINVWSILMPAVYQLVPGSIIARMWFLSIFPPPSGSKTDSESVFSNLMVISTSLALGLIFGFAMVQLYNASLGRLFATRNKWTDSVRVEVLKRKQVKVQGMYIVAESPDNDPDPVHGEDSAEGNQDNDGYTLSRQL